MSIEDYLEYCYRCRCTLAECECADSQTDPETYIAELERERDDAERRAGALRARIAELKQEVNDAAGCHVYEEARCSTDPTPWCHACHAQTQQQCKCGPLADNR